MNELRHWVACLLRCKTLDDIREALIAFSEHPWTLEEKAVISSIYTPRAKKFLGEREDKYRWFEDLAELCWRKRQCPTQG